MLTSISPLGERARASRWWVTTTSYVVSSVVGGLALGLVASTLGSLLPASWRSSPLAYVVVAVALVTGLLLDLGVAGGRLPTWRRQVDQAWLGRYRGWVVGVGFGAQLGFGLVTIVTSATTYAVALLCCLRSPTVGLVIGGTFGLVRALPSAFMGRVVTREQLWRVLSGVERGAPAADLAARLALAAAAATLTVIAMQGNMMRRTGYGISVEVPVGWTSALVRRATSPTRLRPRPVRRGLARGRGARPAWPARRAHPPRAARVDPPAARGRGRLRLRRGRGARARGRLRRAHRVRLRPRRHRPVRAAGRAAARAVAVRHQPDAARDRRAQRQPALLQRRGPGVLPLHGAGQPLAADGAPCPGRPPSRPRSRSCRPPPCTVGG